LAGRTSVPLLAGALRRPAGRRGGATEAQEFLDVPWDEERGRKAAKDTSFKTLQREERSHGFKEKPANVEAFFRKGRAGDWRTTLAPDLALRLCVAHEEVMRRVGYHREVEEVLGASRRAARR